MIDGEAMFSAVDVAAKEQLPKAPDFLELLMQSMVERIKKSLMEDFAVMINEALSKVDAEDVQGLEQFVDKCFEEHTRNINIDADDIEGLDDYIKETLKQATISIDV